MENALSAPARRLRGRSRECALLDDVVAAIRRGESRSLVLRGEAGVGKTALMAYVVQQAGGFQVVQIDGVESEMELPFAGLHQLCTPILGQLDALPAPQHAALRVAFGMSSGDPPDRFLVALAALSLMAAAADERPLLCLLDDAQWLDRASTQVLGFVARRLLAEAAGMVFAVREPTDGRDLVGLPELRLEGLAEDDARALLETSIYGRLDERVRDRIVAETRGNPLALLELPSGPGATRMAGGFALPDAMDVPAQIEDYYRRRIAALPEASQQLLLLAAADAVGDSTLLWRAAQILGLGRDAAEPAARAGVLDIASRVRFRHPLVRSAVYRAASLDQRRAAHGALAAATDPERDPDRRAWHRAHAVTPPDEAVARELLESASRAESRGGIAAAAAFLDRAVTFTEDPRKRASRALAAAQAKFDAADFLAAESLLASADAGPLDELSQALLQRTRAQIAFDLRRGRDAPPLLLRAAKRLEPLDADLARDTHLQAMIAAIYAGELASPGDTLEVARAARGAPLDAEPLPARQRLLRGLAIRLTDGYAAAAGTLTRGLRAYLAEERGLDWLCVAFNLAAMDLWDEKAWLELASSQVQLARTAVTPVLLPYALDYLAGFHVQAGDLSLASELLTEARGLDFATRAATLPYIPLRLAAWRGDAPTALALSKTMTLEARVRGEGCAIAAVEYAKALLYNGLGLYEQALEAAQKAVEPDEIATSSWAMYELVEAAAHSGRLNQARDTADRLLERTAASGTAWALGTGARSRALVESGEEAGKLHLEAIEWLGRTRMVAHLARARLSYGEWLRREKRRADAREVLRQAHEAFTSMGAGGFADRARRELLATGERVRKRRHETRDDLTPQEEQIARLACDGRTNPQIGEQLYLSPRTVEWHLHKVFAKLGIDSRRGLRGALAARDARRASA
jgi:DNA-binding CsgD family transcriptional regulator